MSGMAQVSNGGSILPNSFGEFIAANYNHVTVVQVQESELKSRFDDDFVTVLQVGEPDGQVVNDSCIEEEIVVYRLPGERLGMALKFEGGMGTNETITKVFIQSINTESPASKVRGQHLEYLSEGDEIMDIDGRPTTSMSRLECIGMLRDAPVCIKIRVKRDIKSATIGSLNGHNSGCNQSESTQNSVSKVNGCSKKVPPPVPPRMATTILSSKRKNGSNCRNRSDSECDGVERPPRKKTSQPPPLPPRRPKVPPPEPPNLKSVVVDQNQVNTSTEAELNINAIESDAIKVEVNAQSLQEVIETKLGQKQIEENRGLEPTLPLEPDVYLDLLADEDRLLIESESDDTGSSVSTIIERFSRTSTANSSFSDHINPMTPTIDIVGRVLSPFEKLERELDHKEALQAFVNKAAAVLMADEDLRQITDESLCDKGFDEFEDKEFVENTNPDPLDQRLGNTLVTVSDVLPKNQIIGPPEEFANHSNDFKDNESLKSIEMLELKEPEELDKELSVPEMGFQSEVDSFVVINSSEEINSIEKEIEIIDKVLYEVVNEDNIDVKTNERTDDQIEDKIEDNFICESKLEVNNESVIEESVDITNGLDIESIESSISSIEELIDCSKCEELMPIISEITEEVITSEVNIKKPEESKTIENNFEPIVGNRKTGKPFDSKLKDIKIENFSFDTEIDLFEDIDDLNREIEALEELVEYEIRMESLKETQKSQNNTNSVVKGNRKSFDCQTPEESESEKRVYENTNQNSTQNNGNKYSPPMSLIPKRLPSATPRKSKSYGNLPALYASYKTPEVVKPSLIPRPVSKITPVLSIKSDSPKQIRSHNSNKVQNSKSVQKSKTRILSERKKNEVLNSSSNENKRTVNQRPGKSALKCKSLMDLTTVFSSADIRNGANDSEESIQSVECVSSRTQNQCNPVLIESNQTKSSLESRPEDQGIGETESNSESIDDKHQKEIIIESCVNSQTLETEDNIREEDNSIVNTCDDNKDKDIVEDICVKTTPSEECIDESKSEELEEEKASDRPSDPSEESPQVTAEEFTEVTAEESREVTAEESPALVSEVTPEVEEEEEDMHRMRKSRHYMEVSLDSTCLPPTYARQPPDGREITMSYIDGSNANIPTIPCETFQTPPSVHEDSGVFIDTDTPSPELDFSRGGVHNLALNRIKYKSNGDNSSDADTGITSMSSDSMDELDSCPIPNYKLKKQINPSTDFLSETATNGFTNGFTNGSTNGFTNNSNKSSDQSKSVRERIAMFDTQRSDELESTDSMKSKPLNSIQSTLNSKNQLMSESYSSDCNSDQISDKSQNGFVFNTKSTFIHKKSSSLSLTSELTAKSQPTTPTPQYSGHLQPSYLRYSSLGSSNDMPIHSGIGVHKPLLNGSALLSSILETRKQNASKLKGLIIPDIPTTTHPAVSKTLPTILSSTSTSSLLLTPKPEEVNALTQKTQSQPNVSPNYASLPVLSDPPWVSNNPSMPKYSPAFKRRQLELPRSLSLLNNVSQESRDSTDFTPSFSRSNSMTTMSANDPQFQFSLSHSKPVIPLMPETAIGSPIDNNSMPSLEEQLAVGLNDPFRHSSVQRRYSAEVFNYNSMKYSLEKRSSADPAMNGLYKTSMNSMAQKEITSNQTSDRSPVLNNKLYDSYTSMTKPIITERKCNTNNTKVSENDYPINRNIFNYNSVQSLNSRNSCEESCYQNTNNQTFSRSALNSDYSDDDSSTISHKTSDGSSLRADDSASDTTSDSLDHAFSPELTRPKVLGTQLTVLKNSNESERNPVINDNNSDSVKNFRALAEQWEQRSGSETSQTNNKNIPPPLPPKPSATRIPPSLMPRTKKLNQSNENIISFESQFCPKILNEINLLENAVKDLDINTVFESPKPSVNTRSDSLSSDSSSDNNSVKSGNESTSSRSRSVSDICKVFESNGSDTSSNKSIQLSSDVIQSKPIADKVVNEVEEVVQTVVKPTETLETEDYLVSDKSIDENETENQNKEKVWDKIKDNDESVLSSHQRMSSIDSLASDSGASSLGTAVRSLGQRTSSATNLRDSLYGSVTSLASSTSIISPQELQLLIEEANQSLETNDINSHNIQVVVLHREYKTSGSIGITLAGGSDCETKEITVHRVINGSLCDRDGRIKKGDRILSINGKILKGVAHKEALDIMKSPRPEVVIVLSRVTETGIHCRQSSTDLCDSTNGNSNSYQSYGEEVISSVQLSTNKESENNLDSNYRILRAEIMKDVAGLGFILEGGKDSPLGDRPLGIKRIFRGGPADKEGTLASGDEVISVNDHSVGNMTRTEAWNFLKKLSEGPVVLVVKRKKY